MEDHWHRSGTCTQETFSVLNTSSLPQPGPACSCARARRCGCAAPPCAAACCCWARAASSCWAAGWSRWPRAGRRSKSTAARRWSAPVGGCPSFCTLLDPGLVAAWARHMSRRHVSHTGKDFKYYPKKRVFWKSFSAGRRDLEILPTLLLLNLHTQPHSQLADADADKPPAFRHFDPKLAKYGSRRGQAAVRAAAAAGSAAADKGNGTSAGPPTTAAGALAGLSQQQQQQQQRRVARAGFQPYQPPVARHEQQAAPEALGQQAVLPGRQQQRPQQQKHDRGRGRQQGQRTGDAAGLAAAPAAAPPPPAPAAGIAAQQPGQQQQQQPGQQQQSAAAQKLLGRLQVEEGRFGRGPRRSRRGRFDDDPGVAMLPRAAPFLTTRAACCGAPLCCLRSWRCLPSQPALHLVPLTRAFCRHVHKMCTRIAVTQMRRKLPNRPLCQAADDGSMTLEEWEARQAAARALPAPSSQQQLSDEELARQLQRQLDLEAAQERAALAQVGWACAKGLSSRLRWAQTTRLKNASRSCSAYRFDQTVLPAVCFGKHPQRHGVSVCLFPSQ